MVVVVGSGHQVREYFAVHVGESGCWVSGFPPPAHLCLSCALLGHMFCHLSLGSTFSPYSEGCGGNGAACGLIGMTWAKQS